MGARQDIAVTPRSHEVSSVLPCLDMQEYMWALPQLRCSYVHASWQTA